jgi:predicted AlkP superfamily pyrophosphatase or phosphodiesterase
LRKTDFIHYPNAQIQKGFYPQRSGNVCVTYQQNVFDNEYHNGKGTTHGSHYTYDTQVPFLLYGWKIKPGKTGKPTYVTDVAPSIAYLLHITTPYGAIGKPVYELENR